MEKPESGKNLKKHVNLGKKAPKRAKKWIKTQKFVRRKKPKFKPENSQLVNMNI